MPRIIVENLRKIYRQQKGAEITAIENLSFKVEESEIVSIVGQTGCGKSTFLRILLGVDKPTSGKVLIDGREPYKDFDYFRGKIAAVFQEDRLLPWRTALGNAKLGLEILNISKREQIEKASAWLNKLGLEGFHKAYPHELSGGMRQRVALARALALEPSIVLFDEAFGHLDEVTASRLRADFLKVSKEQRYTTVMVTHNLDEAIESTNRILVFGKPARVLADIRLNEEHRKDILSMYRLRAAIQRIIEMNQPVSNVEEVLRRL